MHTVIMRLLFEIFILLCLAAVLACWLALMAYFIVLKLRRLASAKRRKRQGERPFKEVLARWRKWRKIRRDRRMKEVAKRAAIKAEEWWRRRQNQRRHGQG